MAPSLFLGVDGGGSRCRARLETAEGRVLGHGFSGPASMRFGFEAARDSIMTATRAALREATLPEEALKQIYAGIGLAGLGQKGAREAMESWRHPFAGAWFEGDGYLAFLGAFNGGEGGIVIAGTGSIGLTYQGSTVRIGGYGFPISDEGSGADIGLNALRHTMRTYDGRAEQSAFSREVLARYANDPAILIDWMERATATDYAKLAPIVVQHASIGDPAARRIMHEAAAKITELVEALLARGVPKVALIGGVADAVKEYMPSETAARLVAPQNDAMAGGVLMAKQKARAVGPSPRP